MRWFLAFVVCIGLSLFIQTSAPDNALGVILAMVLNIVGWLCALGFVLTLFQSKKPRSGDQNGQS